MYFIPTQPFTFLKLENEWNKLNASDKQTVKDSMRDREGEKAWNKRNIKRISNHRHYTWMEWVRVENCFWWKQTLTTGFFLSSFNSTFLISCSFSLLQCCDFILFLMLLLLCVRVCSCVCVVNIVVVLLFSVSFWSLYIISSLKMFSHFEYSSALF